MSNLNAFGNNGLRNQTAGRTIGERREIAQKNAINNIPNAKAASTDVFRTPDAADPNAFGSPRDKYAGEVSRYVRRETGDHAAYRHARVQHLHDGRVGANGIRDDQRLAFLEKIISTPALHSQNSIRRFATTASQAKAPVAGTAPARRAAPATHAAPQTRRA